MVARWKHGHGVIEHSNAATGIATELSATHQKANDTDEPRTGHLTLDQAEPKGTQRATGIRGRAGEKGTPSTPSWPEISNFR